MDCIDTRACCFRGSKSVVGINQLECTCLRETYMNDGECPFCKQRYYDKGSRSQEWEEKNAEKIILFSILRR